MFKKLVKKLAVAATLVGMAATLTASAACKIESKHPKVRITVEFNSEVYELDYTLYRNMYPNTVRHFIELAENGVYDDVLVHDNRSVDWLSGGYSYNAEEYTAAADINAYADYLHEHSVEQKYMDLFHAGAFTPTVYSRYEFNEKDEQVLVQDSALPTLIGEFYDNIKQEIEKGALTAEMGTLKMFYYSKESSDKKVVNKAHVTPTDDQIIWNADYKNNCATTVFAMQMAGASALSETKYCVFGKMDSTSALTKLMDAVADYYVDDEDTMTIEVQEVSVDSLLDSEVAGLGIAVAGTEQKFNLPSLPIVIKSVKVTKY